METDMIKHYLTRSRQEKNYISYILLYNSKTRNYNLQFDLTKHAHAHPYVMDLYLSLVHFFLLECDISDVHIFY